MLRIACFGTLGVLFALPAEADDLPLGLTEIRGGINVTGVELWTAFQPYPGYEAYRSLDTVEVELIFTPPADSLLTYLFDPKIELGAHISTLGRASLAHLGLQWGAQVFTTPAFVDVTLGGAITNSALENTTPPNRNVGCPLLIYFGADVGYQVDEHWSVMGSIYHASHAGLCNIFVPDAHNDGVNGFGVKVGYRF